MKVGAYFPGFQPSSGGGYTFEQELLRALSELAPKHHHQFTLFFEGEESDELPSVKNLRYVWLEPQESLSPLKQIASKITEFFYHQQRDDSDMALQKAAEKEKIEFFWFPTLLSRPIEIPYIATVWDIQHRNQPWFPEVSQKGVWDQREAYYSRYLRRAAYILTPNAVGREELAFFYQIPGSHFRVLPHPVPQIDALPSSDEVMATLRKHDISVPYLFYPAQFWAHKNHVNLLKALKILRDVHRLEFDLVFCGSDQGNLSYVQSLVEEMGLGKCVHFLGFIPHEELIALYSGAFALTYVTFFGPENLPPLEAFACDCPVIASNVQGAQEQLGDAAIQISPTHPEQIAEAVKGLYENPQLLLDLISRGRLRSTGFSATDYVRGVFELVDEFEPVRINWK